MINPLTGKSMRRQRSARNLGIIEHRGSGRPGHPADYIDRICAWAAGCGITIQRALPPELRLQRRRQKARSAAKVRHDSGRRWPHVTDYRCTQKPAVRFGVRPSSA